MGTVQGYNSSNNYQRMVFKYKTIVVKEPRLLVMDDYIRVWWVLGIVGGCPKEWAARIESKLSVIYIWGPSKFCSLDVG